MKQDLDELQRSIVALLMFLIMFLSKHNKTKYPQAFAEIGELGHGKAQ